MRHIFPLLLLLTTQLFVSLSAGAQTRGRIENVSDYRLPPANTGRLRIGSQKSAPIHSIGSPKLPIILVQFADLKFSVAETDELVNQLYTDFFNAPEGVTPGQAGYESWCSVREYYRLQSGNLFTPEFTVIGPVTLDKSYKYYGENSGNTKDIHISTFYSEACQKAASNGQYPWSDFDNNQNGNIDFVFFIYAGRGENEGGDVDANTIWPKESATSLTVQTDNGSLVFGSYGCANELFGGGQDGIGAIIHELGHGLGLPDFYDTNYNAFGLDYWDIMDSGCYQIYGHQPCGYSAYELDFMGWRPLVTLHPDSAYTLTLTPLETSGAAYKLPNPANSNEYLILENRQNIGCDTNFGWPAKNLRERYGYNHGLMVTHVDFNQSAWNGNYVNTTTAHQRITIVPADGALVSSLNGLNSAWANSLRGDFYPGSNGIGELSSYKTFTGSNMGLIVNNIQETADGLITLDINGGVPTLLNNVTRAIDSYKNRTDIPLRRISSLISNHLNAQ